MNAHRAFGSRKTHGQMASGSDRGWLCTMASSEALSTSEWPRQQTNVLIELMQLHPCLWQVKSTEYRDRDKKRNALQSIRNQLNSNVTEDIISRKIVTLRGQYRREMRSLLQSSRSGAGSDDLYVPKLWCFSSLKFLGDGDEPRPSKTNIAEQRKVR